MSQKSSVPQAAKFVSQALKRNTRRLQHHEKFAFPATLDPQCHPQFVVIAECDGVPILLLQDENSIQKPKRDRREC
jgi:hypothetical protein